MIIILFIISSQISLKLSIHIHSLWSQVYVGRNIKSIQENKAFELRLQTMF